MNLETRQLLLAMIQWYKSISRTKNDQRCRTLYIEQNQTCSEQSRVRNCLIAQKFSCSTILIKFLSLNFIIHETINYIKKNLLSKCFLSLFCLLFQKSIVLFFDYESKDEISV